MRLAAIWMCFWPGLARLWLRGQWSGLLSAILFAASLNLALVTTFVWTDLVGSTFPRFAWLVISVVWLVTAWRSFWSLPKLSSPDFDSSLIEDLFLQAQTEYLCGPGPEAESLLRRILRINPEDVDTRLMLATLYRHTRRLDEARSQLKMIQQQPGSGKWYMEVQREHQLLSRLAQEPDVEEDEAEELAGESLDSGLASAA